MKAKLTLFDDAILLLAVWAADDRAAIVGSLRNQVGELLTQVIEQTGPPWPALAAALAEAQTIGAYGWIILCNDQKLVKALQHPWVAPSVQQQIWVAKGEYVSAGYGGDGAQWEVYQRLGMQGRWTVVWTDKLEKARELWHAQQDRS